MTISLELVNELLAEYEDNPFFTAKEFHAALEAAQEPVAEQWTERRITYQYGVNKDQRYSGRDSFEGLIDLVRNVTMGEIDVLKKEHRVVTYGEWERVETPVEFARRQIREREAAENRQIFNSVVDNLPEKD